MYLLILGLAAFPQQFFTIPHEVVSNVVTITAIINKALAIVLISFVFILCVFLLFMRVEDARPPLFVPVLRCDLNTSQ